MSDITVEDCIKWLDAKWSRHGELEDKEAAYYLRQLADTQRKLEAVKATFYVSMLHCYPEKSHAEIQQEVDRAIEQSNGGDDD